MSELSEPFNPVQDEELYVFHIQAIGSENKANIIASNFAEAYGKLCKICPESDYLRWAKYPTFIDSLALLNHE